MNCIGLITSNAIQLLSFRLNKKLLTNKPVHARFSNKRRYYGLQILLVKNALVFQTSAIRKSQKMKQINVLLVNTGFTVDYLLAQAA